jgi:acetyl-CoA carboxylase carboxyltransferase component
MMGERRTAMLAKIDALHEEQRKAVEAGGKYIQRHRDRSKLTARERIELLLDEGSAFLELQPLIGWGSDFALGGSMVTGIGVVEGVECMIVANDPTVKGGALNPFSLRKSFRAAEIAAQNGLPSINLTESGGADLPTQRTSSSRAGGASATSPGPVPPSGRRSRWSSATPPPAGPTCPA